MRQTIVAAITASVVAAIVASWATAAIIAHSPKSSGATATATSNSIDVMQLMRDAKNLPEEKWDTH
ncbi:MAG TPA: hypothetical protein VGQ93_07610 [Lysobacter sp.]|nr:hypothetical protein [Lysobacter sp.]